MMNPRQLPRWARPALAFISILALCGATASAADAPADDVFGQMGLKKVGFLLITADEAPLHTAAASIRALKSKVAYESAQRASMARSVATAEDICTKLDRNLQSMSNDMKALSNNPFEYNKRVDPYNAALAELKRRGAALDELRKKQAQTESHSSQAAYNDAVIAASQKSDEVSSAYEKLAKDAALSAAIARYNKTAAQAVKLGPSGMCVADIAFIKKCISDMAADGIPVQNKNGIPVIDVVINGTHANMMWDSGASCMLLSAESAAEMGIIVPDDAPKVTIATADGRTVECKSMVVPEVRVGPFTAQDVESVVLPSSVKRSDDLLGQSFQKNFQARLDLEAGVLRLTPNVEGARKASGRQPAVAAGAAKDPFASKGLAISNNVLVATQELDIHKAVQGLRGLKLKVASEANARLAMSRAVESAADAYIKLEDELTDLDAQMGKVKGNSDEFNRLVDPYNQTLKLARAKRALLLDLRKKLGRMEDSQSSFTETALASAKLATAAQAAYAPLAKDPGVQAAIGKYNKANGTNVTLGPSADFAKDVAFLKQTVEEITAEGIPFRIEGGVPTVEVTVNDKSIEMIWDSGASLVCFSAESAAELGLRPTAKDPSVKMNSANGKETECKLIVVPSISVGGYTAENVECVVFPAGGPRGPDLLGSTFQSHFVCRLDRKAGVIHLSPNSEAAGAGKTQTPSR